MSKKSSPYWNNTERSHLWALQEFSFLRKELQSVLNCIDFAYIFSLFLNGNDPSKKTYEDKFNSRK